MKEQNTTTLKKKEPDTAQRYKIMKIIQFVIIFGFEAAFLIILISDSALRTHIYDNRVIFTICCITWGFMLLSLLFLLYDFITVRKFIQEKHYLSQVAYLDDLTGIPNRHSIDMLFKTYNTPASLEDVCCAVYKIANIKEINAALTHEDGDAIIRDFCELFETLGDEYGFVGRNGGNEFIIVINDCTQTLFDVFNSRLQRKVSHYNSTSEVKAPLTISCSYVLNSILKASTFSDLLSAAYQQTPTKSNVENKLI